MYKSSHVYALFVLGTCVALNGCASTHPTPYSGIASSSRLQPNNNDKSGRVPYSYSTAVDWGKYSSVIVEPVTIYRGDDNQFQKVSEEDKRVLAQYMRDQFREKLRQKYSVVSSPNPDTLRVEITLTGAKRSTRVLSTALKFDLTGGSYNAVQGVRGKEGALTGSVSYAVEIYEASTNRLLSAYVEKQYPNAMNVKASFGALGASRSGIRKGAEELVARLN
jgi:hypothetical protein